MTESAITPRSRIRVYTSTSPALVGYADSEDHYNRALSGMMASPDKVTTPAKALEFLQELRRNDGGVFRCVKLVVAATGEEIDPNEVQYAISGWEYSKKSH